MKYEIHCDTRFIAYTNLSASKKDVNFAVQENCSGQARVSVIDFTGKVVRRIDFVSPGGAITLTIDPTQKVETFCDGGKDPIGCQVEVSF